VLRPARFVGEEMLWGIGAPAATANWRQRLGRSGGTGAGVVDATPKADRSSAAAVGGRRRSIGGGRRGGDWGKGAYQHIWGRNAVPSGPCARERPADRWASTARTDDGKTGKRVGLTGPAC
jgi:hypothetical protein